MFIDETTIDDILNSISIIDRYSQSAASYCVD